MRPAFDGAATRPPGEAMSHDETIKRLEAK